MGCYQVCPHCLREGRRVILCQQIGNVAVVHPEHAQFTSYVIPGEFTATCGRCHRPTNVAAGQVLDNLARITLN